MPPGVDQDDGEDNDDDGDDNDRLMIIHDDKKAAKCSPSLQRSLPWQSSPKPSYKDATLCGEQDDGDDNDDDGDDND